MVWHALLQEFSTASGRMRAGSAKPRLQTTRASYVQKSPACWRNSPMLPFVLFLLVLHASFGRAATLSGTFKVGVVASLTGDFSQWSDAVNGYAMWASAINTAGGIVVRDINSTTHRYGFEVIVLDDNSTASGHATAVNTLLTDHAVHFVLGASPPFADQESVMLQTAGRLNIQCCATAASIYARDQKNVFGISVDNTPYTSELFTEFRAKDIYQLAIIYRDDVLELQSTCQGVVTQAKAMLLTVSLELRYSNSSNATLFGLMDELAASPAEALIMCGLSAESSTAAVMIDRLRKPLKAIVFTSGPYDRQWSDNLGNLSVGVTTFSHWASDLGRKDDFYGDSSSYAGRYKSIFGDDANYIAAAASATGYVLQTVLSDLFKSCTLSPAALADPSVLMFTQGAITCNDNNNRGHDRLITALSIAELNTFYGSVNFNRFRQNQGYTTVTMQVYEVTENLQLSYKPSLVLPLSAATRPLLLPQPNRYAPVCQPGTYRGPDDFEPCIECSPGSFQEFSGRTSCELCPKDYYANSSAMPTCIACPGNTLTILRGSTNLTDCICKPGYYNRQSLPGLRCEPCPDNAICAGDTSKPSPFPGFYAETDAPFTMYRCNPSSVCTGNFTCKTGYRGRMCYYCSHGYFRFLGNCVRCPRDKSIVLGYLIILALLWIFINVWFARAVENLMVIVNFCQLMSIVVGFSLNWPEQLYQVMSLSSILSFEMDSLEPTCLVPSWGFAHNLAVQLLLPIIMAVLIGIWILFTYSIFHMQQARLTRSTKQAKSMRRAEEAPWKQMLWEMLDVPADRRELQNMILERWAIPLNFLNIGFLVQLKYNLNTFSCTSINGVKYMSASPNDECFTHKHWNLILLGISGIICYNFGFVCLYGQVIREVRKYRSLGDRRPLLLYGWMYERYEAQFCWYEVVSIMQRTGFVLVALFFKDPALQAVLCMMISIAVLLMDISTSAYMDKHIYLLQAITDGVLGALLVAGLLFYNPLSEASVVKVVELLLFAAVIASFITAIVSIIEALATRLMIMWLMSKHRPIASKIGQRVKGYRHVYHVFGPIFLFNWLRRCSADEWSDWHRLCTILIDYVHPTSEVSYLSLKKTGRFWRYLLSNFPETIDYLVSVHNDHREHFNSFIEAMYDSFFDTREEHQHQVYYYINDKFKAAFAQWLSSCDEDDRTFCQQVMKTALEKSKGVQAANQLASAMSRSQPINNAVTVLSAVEKFKRGAAGARPQSLLSPTSDGRSLVSRPSIMRMSYSGGVGGISVRFRNPDLGSLTTVAAASSPVGGSPPVSAFRGSRSQQLTSSPDRSEAATAAEATSIVPAAGGGGLLLALSESSLTTGGKAGKRSPTNGTARPSSALKVVKGEVADSGTADLTRKAPMLDSPMGLYEGYKPMTPSRSSGGSSAAAVSQGGSGPCTDDADGLSSTVSMTINQRTAKPVHDLIATKPMPSSAANSFLRWSDAPSSAADDVETLGLDATGSLPALQPRPAAGGGGDGLGASPSLDSGRESGLLQQQRTSGVPADVAGEWAGSGAPLITNSTWASTAGGPTQSPSFLRRGGTAGGISGTKLFNQPSLGAGDMVFALGNPDAMQLADSSPRGINPEVLNGDRAASLPPLELRGDSADSLCDIDGSDVLAVELASPAALLPVPRVVATPSRQSRQPQQDGTQQPSVLMATPYLSRGSPSQYRPAVPTTATSPPAVEVPATHLQPPARMPSRFGVAPQPSMTRAPPSSLLEMRGGSGGAGTGSDNNRTMERESIAEVQLFDEVKTHDPKL